MNNDSVRDLCLSLLRAESGIAVIEILKEVGYWDDVDS